MASKEESEEGERTKLEASEQQNVFMYGRKTLVPPPLKYNLKSGIDFEEFIKDFEFYCEHMYPGVQDTWSRLIGQYLEGELRTAYDNLEGGRLKYGEVKAQLQIVSRQISLTKDTLLNRFWEATRGTEETIITFAIRLDRLAKLAGMLENREMYKELKKIKILESLTEEMASKVKFEMLTKPDTTEEQFINIASNVEKCFKRTERKTKVIGTAEMKEVRVERMKKCDYCQREGHIEENCYQKNGQCYICKKKGHRAFECYFRDKDYTETKPRTEVRNNLQCPFCGEGHLMKHCEEFKDTLRSKSGN